MYQNQQVSTVDPPDLRTCWANEGALGGWVMLDSPIAASAVATQPLDYVVVDCQHGLAGYPGMVAILGALASTAPTKLVRVPSLEAGWPGLALDAGAEGVIAPLIDDADDARAVVAATKYPPSGSRSFGPVRASRRVGVDPRTVNENTICIVMVETAAGLEHIDEICAVPGVDAVYIGPADLSISLGMKPWDRTAELDAAINVILESCNRHGVVAGIHASSGHQARSFFDQGFAMVTAVSDLDALRRGLAREMRDARGAEP